MPDAGPSDWNVKQAPAELRCECSDPGCPGGHGATDCRLKAEHIVRRIDMDDGETRFAFCLPCTDDALDSGVFAYVGQGEFRHHRSPGSIA